MPATKKISTITPMLTPIFLTVFGTFKLNLLHLNFSFILPFCAAPHKTEERRQYQAPLNLRHLIAEIASGADIS
jgi:hypothetical protein